ncbi:MAG: hypothetical protein WCY48_06915 [Candidatus Caldatribacteriota bacterium]
MSARLAGITHAAERPCKARPSNIMGVAKSPVGVMATSIEPAMLK